MRPYVKQSHTRLVLHPSSGLFNSRVGLALIAGVLLASVPVLLLTDRTPLGGTIFPKETGVQG
jgi:hypothetical protein